MLKVEKKTQQLPVLQLFVLSFPEVNDGLTTAESSVKQLRRGTAWTWLSLDANLVSAVTDVQFLYKALNTNKQTKEIGTTLRRVPIQNLGRCRKRRQTVPHVTQPFSSVSTPETND